MAVEHAAATMAVSRPTSISLALFSRFIIFIFAPIDFFDPVRTNLGLGKENSQSH